MILTASERELFFPTINELIERAGIELIRRGDVPFPGGDVSDDEIAQRVLKRLWSDTAFYDEIVDSWKGLTASQREILASWRGARRTSGFIVFRGPQAYFLADGYAFALSGLEKPLDTMLLNVPARVETTLLPFGKKIAYDTALLESPIAIGAGMRKMIEDDLDRLADEGKLIKTGDELIARRAEIEAHVANKEAENLIREAEDAMHGDDVPEGFHIGVLAGLEGDEREEALLTDEEEQIIKRTIFESLFDDLADFADRGKPRHALADMLGLYNKEHLGTMAKTLGLKGYSKLRKQELADLVAKSISKRPDISEELLSTSTVKQIDALHDLAKAGGTLVLTRDAADVKMPLPEPKSFLCHPFYADGTLTIVMPDEIVAISDDIDWEAVKSRAAVNNQAIDFADAVASLRGIVPFIDLAFEYKKRYPDGLSHSDFIGVVTQAVNGERVGCDLLIATDGGAEDASYLVNYDLSTAYRGQAGIQTDSAIMVGELGGTYLEQLLDEQAKVEPRPLMDGVNSPDELEDWILDLPALRALVRYLDGHVPDGQPDRAFADNVMSDLVPFMRLGVRDAQTVGEYFGILEDHGFIPTKEMLNRVMELLTNAANSVPLWPNNGWSAYELHDRRRAESGASPMVFYDEDGKPMKVGRNDPCPCGSGKKYKKCHGRRA